jgi:PleD family two-component response regulator
LNACRQSNGRRKQLHRPRAHAIEEGFRILVVDDNLDSALSLAMMLSIMGHETRTAHRW